MEIVEKFGWDLFYADLDIQAPMPPLRTFGDG
jgi:hypothetical protein